MSEAITDIFSQPGAGGDHRQPLFEPLFQGGDDRRGMLLSRVLMGFQFIVARRHT